MQPKITGENDERVGISVIDNNDVEHLIEMEFDGEIKYHEQEGYPDDPPKRADWEDEMVSHARRYARWYVFQQRGYDVVPWEDHPSRLAAVMVAIHGLSDEAFEELFDDYYRQVVSHHRDDVDHVFTPPVEFDSDDQVLMYLQDVYLSESLDEYHDNIEEQVGDAVNTMVSEVSGGGGFSGFLAGNVEAMIGGIRDAVGADKFDMTETASIDTVSGIHTRYPTGSSTYSIEEAEDPRPDEEPDARLELYPFPLKSLDHFRSYLYLNLACQIRDCYLGMGIDPPEPYRILGPGKWVFTSKYDNFDMYPLYYDPTADINGYTGAR